MPLFDGKMDFTLWQCTIQDFLVQQGLDSALLDEKPIEMKESEWSTMQKKAVSTIRLALAPQIKITVVKETSPKKLWDILESKYASMTLTNRLMMKMDLYSLKMEEGGNIIDHSNKFNELVSRLQNVGETIKEEEKALLILASLPKSFKPLVQSMLAGKSTLQFDEVMNVLKESHQLMGNEDSSGESRVLAMESSERGRKKGGDQYRGRSRSRQRNFSTVECHYCGELGHIQVKCPKFKEDLKSLKELKGKPSVNVVNDDELLLLNTATIENKSSWILDYAVDVHICTSRDLFDTLHTKGAFGFINVGNSLKQKIEGIGRVRLKLHNDKVMEISNVKYVPTCKANIISLGELTSQGYKYVGIGKWCRVYKGGSLVMQGRKQGKNIYYLDGHAVSAKKKSNEKKNIQKTEKRVRFSDKVEICETLRKGRICYEVSQSPTSNNQKTWRVMGSYK